MSEIDNFMPSGELACSFGSYVIVYSEMAVRTAILRTMQAQPAPAPVPVWDNSKRWVCKNCEAVNFGDCWKCGKPPAWKPGDAVPHLLNHTTQGETSAQFKANAEMLARLILYPEYDDGPVVSYSEESMTEMRRLALLLTEGGG